MKKIRVYKIAKLYNISSKDFIEIAKDLDINLKSHLSTISKHELSIIEKNINKIKQLSKPVSFDWNNDKLNSEFQEHVQKSFNELENIDDLLSLIKKVNKKIYGKYFPEFGEFESTQKKYLTYYAYHLKSKYEVFKIPKKSGGDREIYSPNKGLKKIQKTLNIIFQAIHKPQHSSHGFTTNRSVVTNAKLHVNKNYVYNIDLENFFPSIHQARVWKRLQYPPFNLNGEKIELANLIANLVCYQYERGSRLKNFLPQGAPTSPILSNIICHRLDKKLFNLAREYNVKYTRYADDMTFSSDHNVYQKESHFLQKLNRIIESENFTLNTKKTRLQKKGYKQEVTGLIVNEKINVSRKYIKNIRALIYLVKKYGEEKAQMLFTKNNPQKNLFLTIQGKLQYLKMVKGKDDSTYKTLYAKFIDAYKLIEVEIVNKDNFEKTKTIIKSSPAVFEHSPKELVDILKKFTAPDSAIKYCVHSDGYIDMFDGNYDKFIDALEKEFEEISEPLKRLSIRLRAKIKAFLFSKELGNKKDKKYDYTWGDNKIKFGWSSPELKKWCLQNTENIPFDFVLPEKNQSTIGEKNINHFKDITEVFKHEIEVRSDNDALFHLFGEIAEMLEFKFDLAYTEENICGKDFYTDFHWLSKGIKKIFEEIKKQTAYTKIEINIKNNNKEFFELYITQEGSFSNKDPQTLLNEVNSGDFADIKKYFSSLCDWSIATKYSDKSFRINYLKPKDIKDIEELNHEPKGFTHILRFYK